MCKVRSICEVYARGARRGRRDLTTRSARATYTHVLVAYVTRGRGLFSELLRRMRLVRHMEETSALHRERNGV